PNKSLDRSQRRRASHQSDPVLSWRVRPGGGPVNSAVGRLATNLMKLSIIAISFVLILVSDGFGAQTPQQTSREKVTRYIAGLAEREIKRYGVGKAFTGEFKPLPTEMESQLLRAFPKHRFLLAIMYVFIDLKIYNAVLLIAVDARSDKVVGH